MKFNIRVYGLLIHQDQILLSDEIRKGFQFTKFPGGGLEFGEGIKDCLIREFREELNIPIVITSLFYLTDFFQVSAYDQNEQIISVYYLVKSKHTKDILIKEKKFDFEGKEDQETHRWYPIKELNAINFHFPIDQYVVHKIKAELS